MILMVRSNHVPLHFEMLRLVSIKVMSEFQNPTPLPRFYSFPPLHLSSFIHTKALQEKKRERKKKIEKESSPQRREGLCLSRTFGADRHVSDLQDLSPDPKRKKNHYE